MTVPEANGGCGTDGTGFLTKKGEANRAALDVARQRLIAAGHIVDSKERKRAVEWALHSESVYGIRATLESAQSVSTLVTIADYYDLDKFLLTVGNGTLDLRTGQLRPFSPDDLITRATALLLASSAVSALAPVPRRSIWRGRKAY